MRGKMKERYVDKWIRRKKIWKKNKLKSRNAKLRKEVGEKLKATSRRNSRYSRLVPMAIRPRYYVSCEA